MPIAPLLCDLIQSPEVLRDLLQQAGVGPEVAQGPRELWMLLHGIPAARRAEIAAAFGSEVTSEVLLDGIECALDSYTLGELKRLPRRRRTFPRASTAATPVQDPAAGAGLAGPDVDLPPLPPSILPSSRSLMDRFMPPIRGACGQGESRDTSIAFAACAVLEYLVGRRDDTQGPDLSEQFVGWLMQQQDPIRATLSGTFDLIAHHGVCLESAWPYASSNQDRPPFPAGTSWPVPMTLPAACHHLSPGAHANPLKLKAWIASGYPIAKTLRAHDGLTRRADWNGVVRLPDRSESPPAETHTVVLVGYVDDPELSQYDGGYFIFRNSWGTDWARHSRFGAGYGTLPYALISDPRWGTPHPSAMTFEINPVPRTSPDLRSQSHVEDPI